MAVVKVDKNLEDIIDEFIQFRSEEIKQLRGSISSKDFNSTKAIGHRLGGSAPSYGFHQLADIAKKIEDASKEENLEKIIELTDSYESFMSTVQIEFE